MEYKLKSSALQDIQTKTVELHATAQELGSIDSGNLLIPIADLRDDVEAADIFKATNLTLSEALTPSVVSGNLVLDGSSAISASNKIEIVIKLK